jgi:FixJ family two-component response regulator
VGRLRFFVYSARLFRMSSAANIYVAVVDDDDSLCRSLGRLLRASGIQSVTYASAEAFLADTKRPRFDCLVLDIQLGGMSGIELNQQLTASGSTTPVIFITAHNEPEIREQALLSGCAAYLRKNESGQVVLDAVARAISSKPAGGEK